MSWLRKIIIGSREIRVRLRGFGFPGAPESIHTGSNSAPLGDPLRYRKIYRGN